MLAAQRNIMGYNIIYIYTYLYNIIYII
jgi:hypothetical protein